MKSETLKETVRCSYGPSLEYRNEQFFLFHRYLDKPKQNSKPSTERNVTIIESIESLCDLLRTILFLKSFCVNY